MPKKLFDSIDDVLDGVEVPGTDGFVMNVVEQAVYKYCVDKPRFPREVMDHFAKRAEYDKRRNKFSEVDISWALCRLVDPDNGNPLMLDQKGMLVTKESEPYENK